MSEEEKKAYKFYKECNDNDLSAFEYFSEESKKQIKYMETLLNLIEKYKVELIETKEANRQLSIEIEQLEKENLIDIPYLRGVVKAYEKRLENSIPKSVIREKIEEYREERNKLANGEFWDEPKTHQDDYNYFIACEVLKELLGGDTEC